MPPKKRTKLSPNSWTDNKTATLRTTRSKTRSPVQPVEEEHPNHSPDDETSNVKVLKPKPHAILSPQTNNADDDELADEILDEIPTSPASPSENSKNFSFTGPGGYDSLKSFKGQMYSGMSVGASHSWDYQPGKWKETKVEPDLWKIDFETDKRRTRNAPKGSGAPVGTEYHWLVVAHQYVRKLDANTYSTHMIGSKYKLAYKNASSPSWSINSVKKQREREVFLLQDAIKRIEGLPPVLGTEKVQVPKAKEKGQKDIASMFSAVSKKRKAEDNITQ